LDAITKPWFDETVPWRRTMLASLGPLQGRRVLLLGNGESYKEFYFLHLGAQIVYTDLSLVAVRRAKSEFLKSELFEEHRDQIEFHAVNAMHLPFPDQTFDIIYGTKFVGFLENTEDFFLEVSRCLKSTGKCRFADDAYSPAWEALRRYIVRPVKVCLHGRRTTSLASVRSASTFGFKEESLVPLVKQCNFSRLVFVRESFFLRIAQLFWGKLVRWNERGLKYARPVYKIAKWFDHRLSKSRWMRRNQLALTWGFDK
jgi:ubiquinone/menaquinone biosynthesis C-methylase UbiE